MASGDEDNRLAAEQRARVLIDRQLEAAGWVVQDKKGLNLYAGDGIAVREVVMKAGHSRVDCLLYVDKAVVGVIEAKPVRLLNESAAEEVARLRENCDVALAHTVAAMRVRNEAFILLEATWPVRRSEAAALRADPTPARSA